MNCPKCNTPIPLDGAFCIRCGTPVKKGKKRNKTLRLIKIIAILFFLILLGSCAIIIPRRLAHVRDFKIATAKKQIIQYSSALYNYNQDTARVSADGKTYWSFPSSLRGLIENIDQIERWKGPYIRPDELTLDPWGFEYQYIIPGEHGPFDLYTLGADGQEGGEGEFADICSWEMND